MSPVQTPWSLVRSAADDSKLPPLLISASFSQGSSYEIYLTDLTYTWSEALSRRSILRRSLDEETSIDPSEDSEQFRVFLQKLESCLNNAKDTSIYLEVGNPLEKNEPPPLILRVTANLPKPLKPLMWPFLLSRLPQHEHTSNLTLPLLCSQAACVSEMNGLVDIVKNKDYVIQKLVDKLIATGTDLAEIFPGVAGKGVRKMGLKDAEKKVKGLAKFDPEQRRESTKLHQTDSDDSADGIFRILGPQNTPYLKLDDFQISNDHLTWWNQIKGSSQMRFDVEDHKWSQHTASDAQDRSDTASTSSGEEDENGSTVQRRAVVPQDVPTDALEIQAGPPQEKGSQTAQDSSVISSQTSVIPDSFPQPKPTVKKKLGAIGGIRSGTISAPSNNEHDTTKALSSRQESSGQDNHDMLSLNKDGRKKQTLGRIGGKKNKTVEPSGNQKSSPELLSPAKKLSPETSTAAGDNKRGRHETRQSSNYRESSSERADRKREELKKTLEDKAKLPARKKRKF